MEPADNRVWGATHKYQGSLSYDAHATSSKDTDFTQSDPTVHNV